MKYSEIYTPEFLKMLADKANISTDNFTAQIDLEAIEGDGGKVDIEFLAKILKLDIIYENMPNGSGGIVDHQITVDETESIERQRFTIGHEIGHFVLGDTEAARKDSSAGYSRTEMEHEKIANAVSAELLMPKKLVLNNVSFAIRQFELDEDALSNDQVALIIDSVAKKMQVSAQALTYRVKNLQLFTD
ncbi:MAG: ImmA/IrrE family metallo-endopeptidase [Leuconostoc lactis]|uniref:ImmA/IrrE family metallo-endopeptidase n=1 Tax=Leuconostoc lactis TaxID=1246 RepID=A0A6L7AB77_LEULA|nr:ImmA/IrrE family metallo-endopeptidase [uncultured Leuconostoc sp.]MWN21358.1 ImmA/IrrE family metallo-endopeptidase [Leuconostoc lactis]